MPNRNLGENRATENFKAAREFEDRLIRCIDCTESFTWTAGEQAFYYNRDLTNPPKRCKACKRAKTHRLEAVERAHANGKRYHYEIRAECAKCSKVTTVPFYPSQGRPVYCRACYAEMRSGLANAAGGGA